MSDFPRTEKAVLYYSNGEPIYYEGKLIVPAPFAIELERELASVRAIAAALAKELSDLRAFVIDRDYTDETADGIVAADAALEAYRKLST